MAKKDQGRIEVITPRCRLSFPSLFGPRTYQGKTKYQTVLLFPPDADLSELRAAIKKVTLEKWNHRPKKLRLPWRDASDKDEIEGYQEGWTWVRVSSDYPPGIVDRYGKPVTNKAAVYGGRWARAQVDVYPWDNEFGRGVNLGLVHVQLLEPGEQFGGRASAADVFDTVEDDEWLGPPDGDDTGGSDDDDDGAW